LVGNLLKNAAAFVEIESISENVIRRSLQKGSSNKWFSASLLALEAGAHVRAAVPR
jgi:hypothetical protein